MNQHSDEAQIRTLLGEYERALNTSDAAAAVAVYAEDGIFYPYNLPTAQGSDALLRSYEQIFSAIRLDIAFTIETVAVDGDLAFASTASAGQVTVLEAGVTVAEANRELFVFVRRGGEWKVAQYMFNKAEAPAA